MLPDFPPGTEKLLALLNLSLIFIKAIAAADRYEKETNPLKKLGLWLYGGPYLFVQWKIMNQLYRWKGWVE